MSSEIKLDAPAALSHIAAIEYFADKLKRETNSMIHACTAAIQGDPYHYLRSGLAHAEQAAQHARIAEAQMRELVRNARSTILVYITITHMLFNRLILKPRLSICITLGAMITHLFRLMNLVHSMHLYRLIKLIKNNYIRIRNIYVRK